MQEKAKRYSATFHPRKAIVHDTAVEIAVDHMPHRRTEKTLLFNKTVFIDLLQCFKISIISINRGHQRYLEGIGEIGITYLKRKRVAVPEFLEVHEFPVEFQGAHGFEAAAAVDGADLKDEGPLLQ